MSSRDTITQFVCFATPLPRLLFEPVWTPFARRFLAQGLSRIDLCHRVGEPVSGEAPDYLSRNIWPDVAFRTALDRREIGEGGGWPVKAMQGGSFEGVTVALTSGAEDRVILALFPPAGAWSGIAPSLRDAGLIAAIHDRPFAGAPARWGAVLEVVTDARRAESDASKVVHALAADATGVAIGIYDVELTLS